MGKSKLIHHKNLPFAYNPLSRRLFVKSSMGFLALPLINSLLPRVAWAASEDEALYRRIAFLINEHGGNFLDGIPRNVAYQDQGHGILAGSLRNSELAPVHNNDYRNLKNKLSILMGLSAPTGVNHSASTPLAAAFSGFQKKKEGAAVNGTFSQTLNSIDTLISRKIYPSNHPELLKVLRFTGTFSFSDNSAHEVVPGVPQSRNMSGISNSAARQLLMNHLVIPTNSSTESRVIASATDQTTTSQPSTADLKNAQRRFVLERALSSLSLTKQNGKISKQAKSKIADYQDMLAMVRDGIPQSSESGSQTEPASPSTPTGTPAPVSSCHDIPTSSDNLKDQANIIAAAMACGATRIAVMGLPNDHGKAHGANSAPRDTGVGGGRDTHMKYMRDEVLPVGAYLMGLMDNIQESNGNSLLENSAVFVGSTIGSSASSPHCGHSMKIVIGGGLNGKLKMGQAIDYQDRSFEMLDSKMQRGCSQGVRGDTGMEQVRYAGRPYNELLITLMQAFGLNQSDYSQNGQSGYGQYHIDETLGGKNYWEGSHLQPGKPDHLSNKYLRYLKERFLTGYNKNTTLKYYYNG